MMTLPLTDQSADLLSGGASIAKASERSLPADERRQAIVHVERIMGREMTDVEARRFAQVATLAPHMLPGDGLIQPRSGIALTAAEERELDRKLAAMTPPVARGLVQSGQIQRTHVWSRWERIRWALRWANSRWLLLGLGLGAAIDLAVRIAA